MKILVTGCAGFIGWKVSEKLLELGHQVVGIDNLNAYYDPNLKLWRLKNLERYSGFKFYKIDIENFTELVDLFSEYKFDAVVNEAARAGVRASIENPWIYFSTNATGTLNILEAMKENNVNKLVLASTSSLYAGQKMPFTEDLAVNKPISPYAASKKAAESIAYTYHYLYGIDVSVLRYFTVYGPAGRPDMSIFRFIHSTLNNKPVEILGDGTQSRDFTFIDDVAEGTILALKRTGFEIINLGNSSPYTLIEVTKLIEKYLHKRMEITYKEFSKADMKATWADITKAKKLIGWRPNTDLEEGIKITVKWFMDNWAWLSKIKL